MTDSKETCMPRKQAMMARFCRLINAKSEIIIFMHIVQVILLGNENLHKILHPPLSPSLLSGHCCHILASSFHLAYLDIVTGIKAVFLVLT